jgi:hypothetical protein
MKIQLTIGSTAFTATLVDNAAATAFRAMLPITVSMSELNGNEKYYYLPGTLPTSASNPGTIRTGDLMLYGNNCIVLFYKTFSTSYSYTRLGSIDNTSGLEAALGSGSVNVKIDKMEAITAVEQAAIPDEPQVIVDNSRLRIIGDFIRFSLMNLNGSVILQGNSNTVDISNLLSGFYLVKMDTRTNTLVRKIVKR